MKRPNASLAAMILGAALIGQGASVMAQPTVFDPAVTQAVTGGSHSCALTTSGGVRCWGDNLYGQLGDGTTTAHLVPAGVSGLESGVVSLALGWFHTCALTESGGVKCWGYNGNGQVGDGTVASTSTPVDVLGLTSGVASISAGSQRTCALLTSGGVKCWGENQSGAIGDGTLVGRLTPVDVLGLGSGVKAVANGDYHTCALKTSGEVRCWGYNVTGALGDGTTTNSPVPVEALALSEGVVSLAAGGSHTCAVTALGGAKCWGSNGDGQLGNGVTGPDQTLAGDVVGLSSGVKQIVAGWAHTCALTAAGGVMCFGANDYGALGDGSILGQSTPVGVSGLGAGVAGLTSADSLTCAVTLEGGARCWGNNFSGQVGDGTTTNRTSPVRVSGLGGGVASAGLSLSHSCVVTSTGGLKCWGSNNQGQVGDGTTVDRPTPSDVAGLSGGVTKVVAGDAHTCALTTSGGVKCWGYNYEGQLGDSTTVDRLVPVDVVGLTAGVVSIAAGDSHTCALTLGGGVKCWGYNNSGQLGNGTTSAQSVPVDVSGLGSGVTSLVANTQRTCALMATGGVKCWGNNFYGGLGDGTTTNRNTPVDVFGLTGGVADIAAGDSHTCALLSSGGLKCWGGNSSGQLGDGTLTQRTTAVSVSGLLSGVTAVATRGYHTCALTSAGGMKCWGFNVYGQLGDGSTTRRTIPVNVSGLTSGVAWIAAGDYNTCAYTAAGSLKCWGYNDSGQLGDGTTVNRSTPRSIRAGQSIAFTPPQRLAIGAPAALTATSTSGLPVTFDTWTPGTCSVVGDLVTASTTELCGIRASQTGDDGTPSAPQVLSLVEVANSDVPAPPGMEHAEASDGRVTVFFSPSANEGNAPILAYTATCGGLTQAGIESPITVYGLPNGVAVACSVVATNLAGDSAPSTASNMVTPSAGPDPELTLTLVGVDGGSGRIWMSDQSLCAIGPGGAATCAHTQPLDSSAYLIAEPSPDSVFVGWTGACASSGTDPWCMVNMSAAANVGLTFRGPQTLTINLVSVEGGFGTVHLNPNGGSPEPLACRGTAGQTSTCSMKVKASDTVFVGAEASAMSAVDGLSGCLSESYGPYWASCIQPVEMSGPVTITATFRGPQTVSVQVVSVEGGLGTVTISAETATVNPVTCAAVSGQATNCSAQVRIGGYAQVVGLPDSLSIVAGFTGCAVEGESPDYAMCTPALLVTDDVAITTTFRGPQTLTLQAVSVENGDGTALAAGANMSLQCSGLAGTTRTCTTDVRLGSPVLFDAFPGTMSVLTAVTGCAVDPVNPNGGGCPEFVMTGPKSFSATFRGPQTLSLGFGGDGSGVIDLPPVGACPSGPATCAYPLRVGTVQDLVAAPSADSLFHSWTGACAGQGAACSLTVTAPLTTQAVFVLRNHPPAASAGGPYAGVRGQAIAFSGAGSSDPDNDPLTHTWDFGDGSPPGSGVAPTHAYATTGTFTATLIVNDGTVDSIMAAATVTISNQAPAANAGGPYSGVRNAAITFDGAGSNDADNDPLTYSWDFGDGSAAGTGAAPTHAYTTTGTFTVTLTVNDGTASSAPATSTVTISNQTPSASAGGPYSGVRNAAISFSSSGSNDPDSDPLTYSWDFGDGSAAGTGAAPTHAYTTTGTFTVTLTVNDGTASSAPATATVTISNQAPSASAGGPYSGVRNAAITMSGAASSDPDNDPLTYSWDFGDGSPAGTGVAPTHAYTTTGTFTVTLTVSDGTTNSAPATSTVTISNQAPVANAGGPYSGTRLAAVTFSGAASSDPDGDALTYAWAFGDGGTGTGPAPTHLYTAVGTFQVTLRVNDGTVNSTPVTTTVQITNVAPTVSITAPAGDAVFHAPASVLVSAAAADPDGSVARVEFFAGGGKIGEALGAPYSVMWSGAAPGVYALTAVVTDSSGATAGSAPVSVLLNAPPVVALTAPADNAQFAAPASITLTASASDSDGTIAQVEFFRGTTSLGADSTSPYSVTWSGAAAGSYTLTAVAMDNRGAVVESVPIAVKVTAALAPTADAYVRASNGNSNFGTATTVTVQQGSSNGNRRWTYMKFDLSSVPTITSARVRVFGAVSATTSTTIQTAVYPVSNITWTETGLTWNNKPATGTTALATAAIVNNSTTARWYELDVTAYLQAEKAAGRNVVTLAFKNLANSSPYVSFTSKEGAAANRPQVLLVP